MTDYKLVPVEPTAEMIEVAQDAYMPFGDMEMAIRMAVLAAPNHIAEARKKVSRPQIREVFMRNGAKIEPDRDDLPDWIYESVFELLEMDAPAVQGEPVAFRYRTSESAMWNYVDWRGPDEVEKDNFEIQYLGAAPQPAEQQSIRSDLARNAANHLTNWLEMDICECEGGHYCGYNEVKRTRDALLEAVEQQPAPDVAQLVEALERISKRASEAECRQAPCSPIQRLFVDIMQQADDALAAHRKQGGDV